MGRKSPKYVLIHKAKILVWFGKWKKISLLRKKKHSPPPHTHTHWYQMVRLLKVLVYAILFYLSHWEDSSSGTSGRFMLQRYSGWILRFPRLLLFVMLFVTEVTEVLPESDSMKSSIHPSITYRYPYCGQGGGISMVYHGQGLWQEAITGGHQADPSAPKRRTVQTTHRGKRHYQRHHHGNGTQHLGAKVLGTEKRALF